MNIENVKALADVLCAKGLSAIEVGEGDSRIRIERELVTSSVIKPSTAQAQASTPSSSVPQETQAPDEISAEPSSTPVSSGILIEVKSPLVGVYYAAPSPDAETFVSIGSKVKQGDVLCIIETMKMMNEIQAEQDGEIVDICIKNGDVAEYGQVLFKIQ